MQFSTALLAALVGFGLATTDVKPSDESTLERRQTCAIPNLGCYGNNDCCGGLTCDFSESCCLNNDGDPNPFDGGPYRFAKREKCGCCRK